MFPKSLAVRGLAIFLLCVDVEVSSFSKSLLGGGGVLKGKGVLSLCCCGGIEFSKSVLRGGEGEFSKERGFYLSVAVKISSFSKPALLGGGVLKGKRCAVGL